MENLRSVAIGEVVASNASNEVLVAYGLGSCIAVCLYDPVAQVGGMVHALLPSSLDRDGDEGGKTSKPAKFVDQGVPILIEELSKLGASRSRLVAQLCGGADVLSMPGGNNAIGIGERNILAAEDALVKANLQIKAQATGGKVGRTVRLYIGSGKVTVRSLGQPEQALVRSGARS